MSNYELLNREVELKDRTPVTQAVEIIMILHGKWLTEFNEDRSCKQVLTELLKADNVDAETLKKSLTMHAQLDYKGRYLECLRVITAYCVQAIREYMDNNDVPTNLAWAYVDNARYELNAHDYASTRIVLERQNSESVIEMIKLAHIKRASTGGKAAAKKFQPLKDLAIKLVHEKNPPYKSRRDAAIKIKDKIIEEGRNLSPQVSLSKDQAVTTITRWLKDAGILPPKPKFKK